MTQAEALRGAWAARHGGVDRPAGDILPSRNWGWLLARGVLLIVVGLLAWLAPGPALVSFGMLFAAFCFADGVFGVVGAVRGARDHREHWGALLFSGIVGIIVGVLFFLFPLLSTFTYALTTAVLMAVWAITTGLFEIAAAIRLRKEIKGEWLLALSGALSVLLGLAIAFMVAVEPAVSALSVAWLIGVYAVVAGVALAVLAFRLRPHRST